MTDLSPIKARAEALAEPSREVDCMIGYFLDDVRTQTLTWNKLVDVYEQDWPEIARQADSHQSIWSLVLPRYTGSTDAALALAERVFPPGDIDIRRRAGCWFVEFHASADEMGGFHKSLPIAICIAIVSATLKAKMEGGG